MHLYGNISGWFATILKLEQAGQFGRFRMKVKRALFSLEMSHVMPQSNHSLHGME
jgi:hypothetical protein